MSSANVDAFRAIYDANVEYVDATLRRLGVASSDVEDVTHDVFVAVHRHFAEYDTSRPIRPWLFGFTMRIARDYRRLARHRNESRDYAPDVADTAPLPDALVDDERARLLCQRALDALDFDKRAIIVMFDIDGCSAQDVADHYSIPLNTAYSRIRLARAEFERQIRRYGGEK